MFGTVHELGGGRMALRFERRFAHPRDKVWRALTDSDELRHWFVDIIDYDRSTLLFTPGAALTFVARDGALAGEGTVLTCTPPTLLEYTWGNEVLRWELSEDDDHTLLVFTNEITDADAVAPLDEGWGRGLERLGDALDL